METNCDKCGETYQKKPYAKNNLCPSCYGLKRREDIRRCVHFIRTGNREIEPMIKSICPTIKTWDEVFAKLGWKLTDWATPREVERYNKLYMTFDGDIDFDPPDYWLINKQNGKTYLTVDNSKDTDYFSKCLAIHFMYEFIFNTKLFKEVWNG